MAVNLSEEQKELLKQILETNIKKNRMGCE